MLPRSSALLLGVIATCQAFSGPFLHVGVSSGSRTSSITMQLDASKVEKFVAQGEKAVSSGRAKKVKTLHKVLKKPSGAVSVGIECSTDLPLKADDLKADFQIFGENGISQKLRGSNAGAIWIEKKEDGSDLKVAQAFAKEQHSAKGDFPGPVAVIRGGVTTMEQAAEAAAAGCKAIGIRLQELGSADDAQELMLAAKGMEMESVAVVSSVDDVSSAVDADAENVMVLPLASDDEYSQILESLPSAVAAVVQLDFSEEVDAAVKKARDLHAGGYSAVLVSGLCTDETNSLELPCSVVKEITSKRSSKVEIKTVGVRDAEVAGAAGLAAATGGGGESAPAATTKPKKVRPSFKKKAKTSKTPVGMDNWGLDEFTMEDEEDPDAVFYEKMKTFSKGE